MNAAWLLLVASVLSTAVLAVDHKEDDIFIGKTSLLDVDVKIKEKCIWKLLNHVMEPSVYTDVREVAREYRLEDHEDKFIKPDVVKTFLRLMKAGVLPRGEVFTHTNMKQRDQVVKMFHLLYFAKDFDTFVRTACYLRERINAGMFVYALTVAALHRDDCRSIALPAPYEIYPFYFVDADVIHKAQMMKMKQSDADSRLMDYYNIMTMKESNSVVIDSRRSFRHVLSEHDALSYFTEDIDLNTYHYYFHMEYPAWMLDDVFGVNKERRGEMYLYLMQQLLARYRLERLSYDKCDIKMLMWDLPLETGYWPKIVLENGEHMPVRVNNMMIVNENNIRVKKLVDGMENFIRDAIMRGSIEHRDGMKHSLKQSEDIEMLGRLIAKDMTTVMKRLLSYSTYNLDKITYVPTALDKYQTFLRDPVAWMMMKRVYENVILFKKMLPKYTRTEFDFPGVRVEKISTDNKLITFWDKYDMDITNALYLNTAEYKKQKSDNIFVNRKLRLNVEPFKVNIEVVSDKAIDSVVRIFLGPKYDCMGRLLMVNDKRLDMLEVDSFIHKLDTGKNTIVRESIAMHNILRGRTWTRKMWDKSVTHDVLGLDSMPGDSTDSDVHDHFWYKSRIGFPHHLLLPKGNKGGLEMQFYVIISPVRTGKTISMVDVDTMRARGACRWTVCMDSMPLGFPFDRELDETNFFTNNMKFTDILIFHRDLGTTVTKDADTLIMMAEKGEISRIDEKNFLMKDKWFDVNMMREHMTEL